MSCSHFFYKLSSFIPLCLLLGGSSLSVFAELSQNRLIEQKAETELKDKSQQLAFEIQRRLDSALAGINELRSLYATNNTLNRAAFNAFYKSSEAFVQKIGVHGTVFIQHDQRPDVSQLISAQRADRPLEIKETLWAPALQPLTIKAAWTQA